MCKCEKDKDPLKVNGEQLYYSNYTTFEYVDGVELVMLRKNTDTPISTRTNTNNRLQLESIIEYALVSRGEADGLLTLIKKGRYYFIEIPNYTINPIGIVKET